MTNETIEIDKNHYKSLMEEVRNLQLKHKELEEQNQELKDNQEQIKKLIKGGTQPKGQVRVEDSNGCPSDDIAPVLSAARKGRGASSSEIQQVLEENGYERSRQSVLNLMDSIADKFDKYGLRKGSASKPTALYHKGSDW